MKLLSLYEKLIPNLDFNNCLRLAFLINWFIIPDPEEIQSFLLENPGVVDDFVLKHVSQEVIERWLVSKSSNKVDDDGKSTSWFTWTLMSNVLEITLEISTVHRLDRLLWDVSQQKGN